MHLRKGLTFGTVSPGLPVPCLGTVVLSHPTRRAVAVPAATLLPVGRFLRGTARGGLRVSWEGNPPGA